MNRPAPRPRRPRLRMFTPMTRGAARAIVVLFILAFLLAGGAYLLSVRAVQGEVSSRASVTQLCQLGNESRAQQLSLWQHIIAISAPPAGQTPAQRAQRQAVIGGFLAYVRQAFAPRDCNNLHGG